MSEIVNVAMQIVTRAASGKFMRAGPEAESISDLGALTPR
jgi:hypothetical protein